MKITDTTRKSFNKAIREALEALDQDYWPEPVIYAEEIDGEMVYGACNKPALGDTECIIWLHVEPDSFGDRSTDYQNDADLWEGNHFDEAALDTLDAWEREFASRPIPAVQIQPRTGQSVAECLLEGPVRDWTNTDDCNFPDAGKALIEGMKLVVAQDETVYLVEA